MSRKVKNKVGDKIAEENAEFDKLVAQAQENPEAMMQAAVNSPKPVKWVHENPARVRDSIKRQRQMAFLKAYEKCGLIGESCRAIGINDATQRAWHSEPWYVQQFKDAHQRHCERAIAVVRDWAIEGEEVPIVGKEVTPFGTQDVIIGTKKVKNPLISMFYVKGIAPQFRDKYVPPEEEKRGPSESPMSRILIRLEMIGQRQQVALPTENTMRVIDITAETPQLTEGDESIAEDSSN